MKFITSPVISRHRFTRHAFLTRIGGTSTGPFASLNFSERNGDSSSHVEKNRATAGRFLGFDTAKLFTVHQVHGDRVLVVDNHTDIRSLLQRREKPMADAIITDQKGIAIGVLTADCVPIILADPVKKVVGIVHAGWKGTADDICSKAVASFHYYFGSTPDEISAAIGPSIGPCCYEVAEKTARLFFATPFQGKDILVTSGAGRWKLDLRKANRTQLVKNGVKEGNISVSNLCTSCSTDLFFSHRREGSPTGRQLSFVLMDTTGEE
ncbi:MAG: peptidoglycan editing factor PgeF [Thermodesulfobacteriota bacterium]